MALSLIDSIVLLMAGIFVTFGILLGEKLPAKVAHKFLTRMVSSSLPERVKFLEERRKNIRTWEMLLVAAVPITHIIGYATIFSSDEGNPWYYIWLVLWLNVVTLWYILKRTRKALDLQLLTTKKEQ